MYSFTPLPTLRIRLAKGSKALALYRMRSCRFAWQTSRRGETRPSMPQSCGSGDRPVARVSLAEYCRTKELQQAPKPQKNLWDGLIVVLSFVAQTCIQRDN